VPNDLLSLAMRIKDILSLGRDNLVQVNNMLACSVENDILVTASRP